MSVIAQWDLRDAVPDFGGCSCLWDGSMVHPCSGCTLLQRCGHLIQVGQAEGWQVRKFIDPILHLGTPTTMEEDEDEANAPVHPETEM